MAIVLNLKIFGMFKCQYPKTISRKERKHNLRDNCKIINRISDDEKTVFIGPRKLSVGHPQDKTLRKLYLYTDADVEK